jgi:hypothetical protein
VTHRVVVDKVIALLNFYISIATVIEMPVLIDNNLVDHLGPSE